MPTQSGGHDTHLLRPQVRGQGKRHWRSVLSPLPDQTVLPSGAKPTPTTRAVWPVKVATFFPSLARQIRTVPSEDPEASMAPSLEKARQITESVCPSAFHFIDWLLRSHRRTVLSRPDWRDPAFIVPPAPVAACPLESNTAQCTASSWPISGLGAAALLLSGMSRVNSLPSSPPTMALPSAERATVRRMSVVCAPASPASFGV